jgi:hypothetical protein
MSAAQDSALSFLLSSNAVEQASNQKPVIVSVVGSMSPKPRKASKNSTSSLSLVPAVPPSNPSLSSAPVIPGLKLPQAGTLSAVEFMTAIRAAGKRVNELGKMYTAVNEVRNDTILAIAGYIGYSLAESFGAQETAARMKASRELSNRRDNSLTIAEKKDMARKVIGTVHGLPNHHEKMLGNLRARIVATTEAMIDYERKAVAAIGQSEGELYTGLAEVERERLTTYQNDLEALEAK